MPQNLSRPTLYLITRGATTEKTTTESSEFAEVLAQIAAAVVAEIDLIQIREKRLPASVLFELTERAAHITHGTLTRLLVNDRADIAAGAGADGVHLTTHSLEASVVRRSFGEPFLIGASTHSRQEACRARDQGADFIVFGPVFPTPSKDRLGEPVGLPKLRDLTSDLGQFPVLALGGISLTNARACLEAGANGIAGISLFQQIGELSKIADCIREVEKGGAK